MFSAPWSSPRTAETQPLLRPLAAESVGSLCLVAVLSGLILAWCVLDQWNRDVGNSLFQIGEIKELRTNVIATSRGLAVVPDVQSPFQEYAFPLTLAFCQFLLMGLLFMGAYLALFRESGPLFSNIHLTSDKLWPSLVLTHVFSIFFLQALMLPKQALSLGLFAVTRGIEIPVAAVLRGPMCKRTGNQKSLLTVCLATAAACTIYFAYTQVSGCLCVWSGHGVMLTGVAFWLVYLLVLALPAANLVCQDGLMVNHEVHPILMLAVQNILASVIFLPVLVLAWAVGWEDVPAGLRMSFGVREVRLLIAWLCLQMTFISLVSTLLINLTDSFWAVALRASRVLWWWLQQVWIFYNAAPGQHALFMSTSCPQASVWSFVMLCGVCMAAAAIFSDRKLEDKLQGETTGPAAAKLVEAQEAKRRGAFVADKQRATSFGRHLRHLATDDEAPPPGKGKSEA